MSKEPADSLQSMLAEQKEFFPAAPVKHFIPKILIVDDDEHVCEEIISSLKKDGYTVDTAFSAEQALQCVAKKTYHLVLVDVFLPGQSGAKLVKLLQRACFGSMVVFLIGPTQVSLPREALQLNGVPCLYKPISDSLLRKRVKDWAERVTKEPNNPFLSTDRTQGLSWEGMRTRSKVMQEVFSKIRTVARTDANILIMGERGTGKRKLARAIHNQSRRFQGPFIECNISTIPHDRIALELFGREDSDGSPESDPIRSKMLLAKGGSIFIDEIDALDERSKMRLLRLLESQIGGASTQRNIRQWDVRVILATEQRMGQPSTSKERSSLGAFFEQTKPILISFPSLRERKEDILPIAYEFLGTFALQQHKLVAGISAEAAKLLEEYPWPGNVTELKQVIEQAVALCQDPIITPDFLPYQIYHRSGAESRVISIPLGFSLDKAEKEIIFKTLEANRQNKKGTAEMLGISRRCLYNKLELYGQDMHDDAEKMEE